MHFGRALYRRQLAAEGFTFQKVIERRNTRGELKLVGLPGDTTVSVQSLVNRKKMVSLPMANYNVILDSVQSTALTPVMAFTDLIQVTYTKKKEPRDFQRLLRSSRFGYDFTFQTSLLRILDASVAVEPNGQFWPPRGFRIEGYWTWELVADDLPFDYDPTEPLSP